jgi:dethiobiotin synthetase
VAVVLNRTHAVRSAMARLQEKATIEALKKQAGVPVLGPLAYEPGLAKSFRRSVTRLTRTAAITTLVKLVTSSAR